MFYSARTQGIGEQGQLEGQPSEKNNHEVWPLRWKTNLFKLACSESGAWCWASFIVPTLCLAHLDLKTTFPPRMLWGQCSGHTNSGDKQGHNSRGSRQTSDFPALSHPMVLSWVLRIWPTWSVSPRITVTPWPAVRQGSFFQQKLVNTFLAGFSGQLKHVYFVNAV